MFTLDVEAPQSVSCCVVACQHLPGNSPQYCISPHWSASNSALLLSSNHMYGSVSVCAFPLLSPALCLDTTDKYVEAWDAYISIYHDKINYF